MCEEFRQSSKETEVKEMAAEHPLPKCAPSDYKLPLVYAAREAERLAIGADDFQTRPVMAPMSDTAEVQDGFE